MSSIMDYKITPSKQLLLQLYNTISAVISTKHTYFKCKYDTISTIQKIFLCITGKLTNQTTLKFYNVNN